ncbi:MAG: ATP-binding cassette domain-containing protein [Acidobacteriota bacterium]
MTSTLDQALTALLRDDASLLPPARREGPQGLRELADRTGLRARRLRFIEAKWWQRDHGPLLAFDVAGTALALEPTAGTYRHLNAGGRPLTDADLAALRDVHVVQAPLPSRSCGLLDLLRPGLRDSRRDLRTLGSTALLAPVLALLATWSTVQVVTGPAPLAITALLLTMFGGLVLLIPRSLAVTRLLGRVSERAELLPWDRLVRLPAWLFRSRSTKTFARATDAVGQARAVLDERQLGATTMALVIPTGLASIAWLTPGLVTPAAILVLAPLIVLPCLGVLSGRLLEAVHAHALVSNGLLSDLLGGTRHLHASGRSLAAAGHWQASFDDQLGQEERRRLVDAVQEVLVTSTPLLALAGLLALSSRDGASSPERIGSLVAFVIGSWSSARVAGSLSDLITARSVLARTRTLLETPPEQAKEGRRLDELQGRVAVRGLSVRYPEAQADCLTDVDLGIEPGEIVALVGPSGSGKSTLLRALLGFEPAQGGRIEHDGVALHELDLTSFRAQVGTVLQEDRLRPAVVRANIGGAVADLDAIWDAAHAAALDDDIASWPMGVQTFVHEGMVSAGQAQRLLIARALARAPRLLILDEATSALDEETEAIVLGNLRRRGVTCLVTTHRESTLAHVDRVYRMEDSRIVGHERRDLEPLPPAPPAKPRPVEPGRRIFRSVALEHFTGPLEPDRTGTTTSPRRGWLAVAACAAGLAAGLLLLSTIGGPS